MRDPAEAKVPWLGPASCNKPSSQASGMCKNACQRDFETDLIGLSCRSENKEVGRTLIEI
jgi:hypothetical protein